MSSKGIDYYIVSTEVHAYILCTSSLLIIVAAWEGLLASCLTTVTAVFILKEEVAFYISYKPLTLSCRGRGCVTVSVLEGDRTAFTAQTGGSTMGHPVAQQACAIVQHNLYISLT